MAACWERSDSFNARTSNSCSTQYVLSVKVEHPGNAQPCSIGINRTLTVPDRKRKATLGSMAGTYRKVLKIVSVAALVVLVAAGCGGSARTQTLATDGVPRALASEWASRASAVAVAAKSGNSCRALQLASSLRDDVVSAQSRVPARLRSPLVTGVNALAARFTCTPNPSKPAKHSRPPKPPDHKHDHGDDHGKAK
jgi:hypothetical protein